MHEGGLGGGGWEGWEMEREGGEENKRRNGRRGWVGDCLSVAGVCRHGI